MSAPSVSGPGPVVHDDHASLRIDERVFPLEVIYGASLHLLERAYVRLERVGDGVVELQIRGKEGGEPRALAGELANEMLNQCIRHRLGDRARRLREAYLAKSFSNRKSTLDALLSELDDEELAEDALEVRSQPEATSPAAATEGDA